MAAIRLENLRKEFDDVVAVRGIDLEVREGDFLVLVGPSGCGKSTTLRLIAGLEDVTAGALSIGDRRVEELPPKERNVAMVFQNYALYPHMSARENMTFGASSGTDFSDEEIDDRVERAAGILDIEPLLDRKPGELSGGERQRVAIGRALVREPEVFLLDEPLSNLDAKLRIQMRAELAQLHQQLRTTTLYVTHDQTEAMTLGDRVAVMNDGRIEQVDPPQRLYDYPESRFVAEFIGSPGMNVIDVELDRRPDGPRLRRGGMSIELSAQSEFDEGPVQLGVRPEDVYLAGSEANPTPTETFTVDVAVTEPLGDSLLVHADVDGAKVKMQLPPRADVAPGRALDVALDRDRIHAFDAESGRTVYHAGPGATAANGDSDGTRGRVGVDGAATE